MDIVNPLQEQRQHYEPQTIPQKSLQAHQQPLEISEESE